MWLAGPGGVLRRRVGAGRRAETSLHGSLSGSFHSRGSEVLSHSPAAARRSRLQSRVRNTSTVGSQHTGAPTCHGRGSVLLPSKLHGALPTESGAWIRDGRTQESARWCLSSKIRESSPSIRFHRINLDTDPDVWEDVRGLQLSEYQATTNRKILPVGTTDDSRPVGPGYVRRSSMGFDTTLL